jgi:hypothetical protein
MNMKKLTLKSATRLALLILSGLTMASLTYVVFPRAGTRGYAAPFAGSISGTVFDDLNGNGTKDTGEPGLVGVSVSATDNLGTTRTATTDSSGNYSLSSLPGTSARIEFSNPPTQPSSPSSRYAPTIAGNTSVQFVTMNGNQTGINAGFINLTDWCKNSMRAAVPCWTLGAYNDPSVVNEPVLVSIPYDTTALRNINLYHARSGQIGSTWGLAFQESTGIMYSSAVMRRHADTGPKGLAGLYAIKPSVTGGGTQVWSLDLNTLSNTFGTPITRDLTTGTTPSHDSLAYDKVGKTGLGDIDISEDGSTLWVVNLEARALARLNVANGAQPTSLTSFDLASASGTPTCTNGVLRPWALKLANGKGYLGVVCTGETATGTPTQTRAVLSAHVLSFNPATTSGAMAFTQELNITDLTFNRGLVWNSAGLNYDGAFQWNSWDSTLDASKMCRFGPPNSICTYPTPILADIEFDNNGDMIIGFIDRTSLQLAGSNYGINGDTSYYAGFSGGDILKACQNNGAFQLESNGVCGGVSGTGVGNGQGPGGGEFFAKETLPLTGTPIHEELAQGGLAFLKGLTTSDVVAVMMDPVTFTSGGFGWFSTTNGDKSKSYEVYAQTYPGTTGKASGLGDVELFCPTLPLELGNRIWLDTNNDGCQDPQEAGLDGLPVNLYKNGVLVGQTTTANGGRYLFNDSNVTLNGASGILPNMTYQISVATNTGGLRALTLSPRKSTSDFRDSDAESVGGNAVITVTTGQPGQSNHNLDIGFSIMMVTMNAVKGDCISAGGLTEITVMMGNMSPATAPNGSGAELTIDLPSTITQVVSASSRTMSSGAGTITINPGQILWNGALNSGDKVTITYLARIGTLQSAVRICPTSTAAFDTNFDGTKDTTITFNLCIDLPKSCPLPGAGLAVPANTEGSGQAAGSVLIYNIYTSGVNTSRQDTRLTLTNTNPVSSVFAHLFFVDGQTCSAVDRFVALTPSQTTSFLASDLDPGVTGYVIAVATDESGCPINFNYLIGSEYVKFDSGHRAGLAAVSITATSSVVYDPTSPTATLPFDGLTYGKLPRAVALSNLVSIPEGNQTMLVLNRLGGNLTSQIGAPGRLFGLLFDDVETASSFTLNSSTCQLRGMISQNFPRTVPRYDQVIPAGRSGWMKLWTDADVGISGAMINYNASNTFNEGHNLHVLTQTGSVSYTIPVYPAQ